MHTCKYILDSDFQTYFHSHLYTLYAIQVPLVYASPVYFAFFRKVCRFQIDLTPLKGVCESKENTHKNKRGLGTFACSCASKNRQLGNM